MENSQVTIALTASRLRGPLGDCLVAVFGGRVGDTENLVFVRGHSGFVYETHRKLFFPGPIKAADADLWSNEVGVLVYDSLAYRHGLQGELEIGSGLVT